MQPDCSVQCFESKIVVWYDTIRPSTIDHKGKKYITALYEQVSLKTVDLQLFLLNYILK